MKLGLKTCCRFVCCLTVLMLCGCNGLLFTSRTRPYMKDFSETRVGTRSIRIKRHRLREPASGYGVNVSWTHGEIARLAKAEGLTRIDFADEHVFRLLLGIYERRTLIVYGE